MLNAARSTRYSSLSLKDVVCLCAGPRDQEAWEEFVSRVSQPLRLVIARTAAMWGRTSTAVVDDLTQATYLKLWEGGRTLLQEFAVQCPEAILGYLKKTAANVTHDYFRHGQTQASGGAQSHVSTADIEPEADGMAQGGQGSIGHAIFLREIDEHLHSCVAGPEGERDRMIFWLYFRQGMSSREIASLPGVGLSAKGVGSVLERLKTAIREEIVGSAIAVVEERPPRKAEMLQNSY